jgi:acyl-CoA synthetase (AMP-forming)/AMP-acid ligase II
VVAFIVPEAGENLAAIEARDFCLENLAPYKIPAEFYFVDEFPRNATGKVLKRDLRELVEEEHTSPE